MNCGKSKRARQAGLTLIEISVATVVLAVTAMGVSASMMTGIAANRLYRENTILIARAQHYLETFNNLQYGLATDPVANTAALNLVFSGNPDLGSNPPSLASICHAFDAMANDTYEFVPPALGFDGTFQVKLSNNVTSAITYPATLDANGDGVPDNGDPAMIAGTLTKQFNGQGCFENTTSDDGRELYAIEIYYRPSLPINSTPRLLLRGFRCLDY